MTKVVTSACVTVSQYRWLMHNAVKHKLSISSLIRSIIVDAIAEEAALDLRRKQPEGRQAAGEGRQAGGEAAS